MTPKETDLLRGHAACLRGLPREPFETADYYEGYDQCAANLQQKSQMTAADLHKLCVQIADALDALDTREASKNA